MAAQDAKNRFGQRLAATRREPMTIEKHGKPVAVAVSQAEFDELRAAKLAQLRAEIGKGLADLGAGRTVDGRTALRRIRKSLA